MSNGREPMQQRAAGGAILRGALLLLIAVVLGAVLLQKDKEPTAAGPATPSPTTTTSIAGLPLDTTPVGGSVPVDPTVTTVAVQTAPQLVKVLVVNGSGVARAASRVKTFLDKSGYDLQTPGNGTQDNFADIVYYNPGHETDAQALIARLGITPLTAAATPAAVPVKPPVAPFDVLIIVGPKMVEKFRTVQLPGAAAAPAAANSKPAAGSSGSSSGSVTKKKKKTTATTVAPAVSTKKKKKKTVAADAGATATKATAKPADPAAGSDPNTVKRTPVVTQDPNQ